jgi:hypothetical protein
MNTEKIMEDIQSVQDNIRGIKSTWGNTIMTLDNIKSGLKADVQKKADEAYQAGLNDAWEAAQKVVCKTTAGGMSLDTLKEIFGVQSPVAIMQSNTAQQAIDKIKAYEDKRSDRIEVGDIVDVYGNLGVVTYMYELKACVMMVEDGSSGDWNLNECKKTGKHYDIQSILEAMRNDR